MTACRICLQSLHGKALVHRRCVGRLYGTSREPAIDVALAKLHAVALAMVGRTSLSGIQRKLSLSLDAPRLTLQVATDRGRYILKPQSTAYPALPENEHMAMRVAEVSGLDVPACGLLPLTDGSLAYVVRRFDRRSDDGKRRQDDFCQLAGLSPRQKYDASAEACAKIVKRHSSEPGIALQRLFKQLVHVWWSGNGDAHLKNFSLLANDDGTWHVSPAYDLLATHLVIEDDDLALPVQGRKRRLDRATWIRFARQVGLAELAAADVLARQVAALDRALEIVDRSFLPGDMKARHAELLRERTGSLA